MNRRFLSVTCDHCGAIARAPISDDGSHLELAELTGWTFAGGTSPDRCPDCIKTTPNKEIPA